MFKRSTFLWLTAALLFGSILIIPFVLNNIDLNRFVPDIEAAVLAASGRALSIEGDLQFHLSRHPWLTINEVSFQNADWSDDTTMASLDHLTIQIDLLALLNKRLVIDRLSLQGLILNLEKRSDTETNWILKENRSAGDTTEQQHDKHNGIPFHTVLRSIAIDDVTINFSDRTADIDTRIDLDKLMVSNHASHEPFHFQSSGRVNDHPFSIHGESDFLDSDVQGYTTPDITEQPLSLTINARSLNTELSIDGTIKRPALAQGIDINAALDVTDLNKVISIITGRSVRDMPTRTDRDLPLKLSAHITDPSGDLKAQDIRLELADSDLTGDILLNYSADRPRLYATLKSDRIDIDKILASPSPISPRQETEPDESLMIAQTPVSLDFLGIIDSRLNYQVNTLRVKAIKLDSIDLSAAIHDARLVIDKLDLKFDGASLHGQAEAHKGSAQAVFSSTIKLSHLKLKTLATLFGVEQLQQGLLTSDITLRSYGDDTRSLLLNLEGDAGINLTDLATDVKASGHDYKVSIDTASLQFSAMDRPLRYDLQGSIDDEPLVLTGSMESLESLLTSRRIKTRNHIETMATRIVVDSQIDELFGETRLHSDTSIRIASPATTIEHLTALIPASELPRGLPELPVALDTSLSYSTSVLRARKIQLEVGQNVLSGDLSLDLTGKKPYLNAELNSESIDVDSLLSGMPDDMTNDGANDKTTGQQEPHRPEKLFSDKPLPSLDILDTFDTDLRLAIDRLSANQQAVENLSLDLSIKEGRLDLRPLQLTFAEGKIETTLGIHHDQITHIDIDSKIRQLDYGRLMKMLDTKEYARGRLDADIYLKSAGNTESEMMAALDGQIRVASEGGALDSQALKFLSKDLSSLIPFTDNSKRQKIRCAVVQLDINRGIADTHSMVLDTGIVSALGTGQFNLRNETLSLYVAPRAKRTSVMKLALVPVNVSGSFTAPSIIPDAAGATLRTTNTAAHIGIAIATSGISLVAEDITDKLWEKFIDDTDYCAKALAGEKVVPTLIKLQDIEPDTEDPDYIEELDDDEGDF